MSPESATVKDLIAGIESEDYRVRGEAWQGAGPAGARAVVPLGDVVGRSENFEVVRAATRALREIVHHAGRPGASGETVAVARELRALLDGKRPRGLRSEAAWLLSEIGGDDCVDALADLLDDREVREDARLALQRIPGARSLAALMRAALGADPTDFKPNLVSSLRARGVEVAGVPCQKLRPCKPTEVEPLS